MHWFTFNCDAQLIGDVSDLDYGVRYIIVIFEKVENTKTEHLESDANVSMIVEPVQDVSAEVLSRRIFLFDCLQHVYL